MDVQETIAGQRTMLRFLGVDGVGGGYYREPEDVSRFVDRLRGSAEVDERLAEELSAQARRARMGHRAVVDSVDPRRLEEAGWGVIFAEGCPSAVREALAPLIDHRRKGTQYFLEASGETGYRTGESKPDFLRRLGAGPGAVDPAKVPYYLLLVGDPAEIPFHIQYQLDVQYAVGRVFFEDPDDYRRYAEQLVRRERAEPKSQGLAAFFAPEHSFEELTKLSCRKLTEPLADHLESSASPWRVQRLLGENAGKQALVELLHGDARPDLLFSAGHGLVMPPGVQDDGQVHGALITQDWSGPRPSGISPQHFFAGSDVSKDADLSGLIAFLFGCFTAGTPSAADFDRRPASEIELDPVGPSLANLPNVLLARGGQAVIGHIGAAYEWSFDWQGVPEVQAFQDCIVRLASGAPVGWAMEPFGQRYAALTADLIEFENRAAYQPRTLEQDLAYLELWAATGDARAWTLLGDPAARIRSSSTSLTVNSRECQ